MDAGCGARAGGRHDASRRHRRYRTSRASPSAGRGPRPVRAPRGTPPLYERSGYRPVSTPGRCRDAPRRRVTRHRESARPWCQLQFHPLACVDGGPVQSLRRFPTADVGPAPWTRVSSNASSGGGPRTSPRSATCAARLRSTAPWRSGASSCTCNAPPPPRHRWQRLRCHESTRAGGPRTRHLRPTTRGRRCVFSIPVPRTCRTDRPRSTHLDPPDRPARLKENHEGTDGHDLARHAR